MKKRNIQIQKKNIWVCEDVSLPHTALLIVGDFEVVVGLPLLLIDTLVVEAIHKFVNCHFVEIRFGVKD